MKIDHKQLLAQAERISNNGNLEGAKNLYLSILKDNPQDLQAIKGLEGLKEGKSLNNQLELSQEQVNSVMALYANGQIQDAIDNIQSLNKDFPNVPFLFNILGVCYKSLGQLAAAAKMFETAVDIKPDYAEAYYNLGVTLVSNGELKAAVKPYKTAIALIPNYPDAHNNLGNIFKKLGKFKAAIESYQWAVAYKPGKFAGTEFNLGTLFSDIDQKTAIKHFGKAIAIKPNFSQAYYGLGLVFKDLGFRGEAIESYNKAINIRPDYIDAHKDLSNIKKFKKNDPQLLQMQKLLVNSDLGKLDRINLNFALANANESLKNQNEQFKFLNEGNRLRKIDLNYSFDKDQQLFSRIKKEFKSLPPVIKKSSYWTSSVSPIFIVGLPRSGTSLVEQIIASHNEVFGAGELNFLNQIMSKLLNEQFDENKGGVSEKVLLSIRQKYSDSLSSLNTSKKIITDKLPLNFRYIGFILSAFPEAKIVHVKRDAIATCWSIYKHYFSSTGTGWAYNQEDIAKYYGLYSELMDFWHELYPNQIYDVGYEDLTTSQEEETRMLLEYCELEWDESCLNFHTNERAVQTASSMQVRKKMYQGSSEVWKEHQDYLKILIKGLSSF